MPKAFVLMPFRDEFDDVYLVIKDACRGASHKAPIECTRSDEIESPGKITDQILDAIRCCDVIIADLSGSNANVMYELGFAHALNKPTVILNQSVKDSPFDVAAMRQIVYDRNRLMKDCRPRLVTAIASVLDSDSIATEDPAEADSSSTTIVSSPTDGNSPAEPPIVPSDKLVHRFQILHLQMRLANTKSDEAALVELAKQVIKLADRITVVGHVDDTDLRNTVAAIGNCAIELEKANLLQQAEDLYKRGIGLCPIFAGIHFQYADCLADAGRVDEAKSELAHGQRLNPSDSRADRIQVKLAIRQPVTDPAIEEKIRQQFDTDRRDAGAAAAYLLYLDATKASIEKFEQVCQQWIEALPQDQKGMGWRALADYLAKREEYERARKIYEELLPSVTVDERPDVLHNLASVCADLDDTVMAKQYWSEAYKLNPQNPIVATMFSQRLATWGELELAMRVASGNPLHDGERVR